MGKGKNSILGAWSCEGNTGKLLWPGWGQTSLFPAIDHQIGYLRFNMVTWPGVTQALKTATLPIYPGRSAADGMAQSRPLMRGWRFISPRKDNKHVVFITRRKRSHTNWKRNRILKTGYMALDYWLKTVSEGTNACAASIPPSEPGELELKGWIHKTGL